MSRTAAYKQSVSASGGTAPLTLLEITHSDLARPVRVVNDTSPVTFEGHVYQPLRFELSLPDDQEGQVPRARFSLDNVGRELSQWIDASLGGAGAQVRLIEILRADPATVEYEVTMRAEGVTMTATAITGELVFGDLLHRPAVNVRYDPLTAPGLF